MPGRREVFIERSMPRRVGKNHQRAWWPQMPKWPQWRWESMESLLTQLIVTWCMQEPRMGYINQRIKPNIGQRSAEAFNTRMLVLSNWIPLTLQPCIWRRVIGFKKVRTEERPGNRKYMDWRQSVFAVFR